MSIIVVPRAVTSPSKDCVLHHTPFTPGGHAGPDAFPPMAPLHHRYALVPMLTTSIRRVNAIVFDVSGLTLGPMERIVRRIKTEIIRQIQH
jgi:hypothetical protein